MRGSPLGLDYARVSHSKDTRAQEIHIPEGVVAGLIDGESSSLLGWGLGR